MAERPNTLKGLTDYVLELERRVEALEAQSNG